MHKGNPIVTYRRNFRSSSFSANQLQNLREFYSEIFSFSEINLNIKTQSGKCTSDNINYANWKEKNASYTLYSVQWMSIVPGISTDLDTINKYTLYHITVRYSKYVFSAT